MLKTFAILLSILAIVSNIANAAKVDVIIGADDEYELHLGNKQFKGKKSEDGSDFLKGVQSFFFNLPPGTYPLSIKASNTKGGIKSMIATVRVDGNIIGNTDGSGKWRATGDSRSNQFEPITSTCDNDGVPSEFLTSFQQAGGDSGAKFIWPGGCADGGNQESYYLFDVEIPNNSPTARKVEFGLSADNRLAQAQIGPLAISKPEFFHYEVPIKFSVYLEPGSFPFYLKAYDSDGDHHGLAVAVSLDGQVISNTDGSGKWRASRFFRFYDDKMTPITETCNPSDHKEFQQMIDSVVKLIPGSQPQVIWPGGCTDSVVADGFFLTKLDIPAKDPASCKNVDFVFTADNQYSMYSSGQRVFRSLRRLSFPLSWRFLSNYTLCLKPGKQTLTFFGYDYGGMRGLIGGITSEGKTLAITGGDGKWKAGLESNKLNPITETCGDVWNAGLPQRIRSTLSTLTEDPKWIWPGGCTHDAQKKHAFFDIDIEVPGAPTQNNQTTPENNNKNNGTQPNNKNNAKSEAQAMAAASVEAKATAYAEATAAASGNKVDASAEAKAAASSDSEAEATAKAEAKAASKADATVATAEASAKAAAEAHITVSASASASASAGAAASADASASAGANANAGASARSEASAEASAKSAAGANGGDSGSHAPAGISDAKASASASANAEASSGNSKPSGGSSEANASASASASAEAFAESAGQVFTAANGKKYMCICKEI